MGEPRALRVSDRAIAFALFAAGSLAAVVRNPGIVLAPRMLVEDATVLFVHYYPGVGWRDLLVEHAGYVSVGPNLFGWIAAAGPVTWTPLLLALLPLLLTAVVVSETWRVLRALGLERGAAGTIAGLLVVLPLGSSLLQSNSVFAYCNLLYLAVLWSLEHLREDARTARWWWVAAPVAITSHPIAMGVVGIYALGVALERSRAALVRLAFVSAVAVVYAAFGVEFGSGWGGELYAFVAAAETWLGRVVFELAFGSVMRALLYGESPAAVVIAGLAIALPVAAGLARSERSRTTLVLGVAFAASAAITLGVVLARWGYPQSDLEQFIPGRRYLHAQHMLLLIAAAATIARASALAEARRMLAVAAFAWAVLLNPLETLHFFSEDHHGEDVARFVAELERREAAGDRRPLRLERGIWSAEVVPRAR